MEAPIRLLPNDESTRSHRIPPGASGHHVHFYDKAEPLVEAVVEYVAAGLAARQPAMVIATGEHRRAILAGLRAMNFDIDELIAHREFTVLDARDTLMNFMDGPMPDWEMFQATVGNLLERLMQERPSATIRAYGEMVEVLCREGNARAAIELEKFWNRMTKKYSFSLLCAYSDGSSLRSAGGEIYLDICSEHAESTHLAG